MITKLALTILTMPCSFSTGPLDRSSVSECAGQDDSLAPEKISKKLHSVVGGLGGAVVEALAETSGVSIRIHGVHGYGESGSHAALYAKHLLDSQGIAQVAKDFILPVGVAKAAG